MQWYSIFFEDFFFDHITQCKDILPRSLLIIDKKIPMLFAHLHSSDTVSLESSMIDESTRWECSHRCEKLSQGLLLFISWEWIRKKWATRKSRRLLHLTNRLEVLRSKSLILPSEWCEIDQCRYYIVSTLSLDRGITIWVVHIWFSDIFYLASLDI